MPEDKSHTHDDVTTSVNQSQHGESPARIPSQNDVTDTSQGLPPNGTSTIGDSQHETPKALVDNFDNLDSDHHIHVDVETEEDTSDDDDACHGGRAVSDQKAFEPPEGGWGWLVCAASFWTNGTLFGLLNVFGILFVEMLEEFGAEGDDDLVYRLSWIGSLQIATTFFMSMFSSILVDQFGIQLMSGIGASIATVGMLSSSFVYTVEVMYFTYGIMIGLGSSLLYTPSISILGDYFRKRLGLVNGLVAFGSAVFTLVLTFVVPALLESIGLRNTMRVLACTFAVLLVCPLIWRPLRPKEIKGLEAVTSTASLYERCGGCARTMKKIVNTNMFKNKGYVVWTVGVPIAFMGYFIPFVHIVNHTREVFPGYNPEVLVTCIGGVSGISRIISGKVADIPNMNRVWIQQGSFLMLGIATSLLPFAGHYGVLIALACIMGISDGCFICMLGPIANDLLGPQGMGQGLGLLLAFMSIPMTAGPPLAGLLRELLGSYKIAFLIAGTTPILGSCILFLMPGGLKPKKPTPAPTISEIIYSLSRENLDRPNTPDARPSGSKYSVSQDEEPLTPPKCGNSENPDDASDSDHSKSHS